MYHGRCTVYFRSESVLSCKCERRARDQARAPKACPEERKGKIRAAHLHATADRRGSGLGYIRQFCTPIHKSPGTEVLCFF